MATNLAAGATNKLARPILFYTLNIDAAYTDGGKKTVLAETEVVIRSEAGASWVIIRAVDGKRLKILTELDKYLTQITEESIKLTVPGAPSNLANMQNYKLRSVNFAHYKTWFCCQLSLFNAIMAVTNLFAKNCQVRDHDIWVAYLMQHHGYREV